jgi:DNA invertase Pin-like site-specific DNA recombinase
VRVTAPDRLARREAYPVVVSEAWTRCGGEVVCVQQRLGTSPAAPMRLQRPGVGAEDERALIPARTRRGQLFAARHGRVTWGNPPEGDTDIRQPPTTPQPGVIHEAAAAMVRQVYGWCVEEP